MRILLIHQFFVVENDPGGSRHFELARYFKKMGCDVQVIAGSVNYMTNRSNLPFWTFWKREAVSGIPVVWVKAFPTLQLGIVGKLLCYISFFLFALIFAFRARTDVVVATSPPPTAALLGWFVSRWKSVPWIFEIRDLWPSSALDMQAVSPGLITRWVEWMVRFLYHRAGRIVTLTWGLEKSLVKSGVSAEKIVTIPNGVDQLFMDEQFEAIPQLESLRSHGKFVVMYVGALGPANHVSQLLRLAKHVQGNPRFFFVLAGDGRERESLEAFCKLEKLSNVFFLGAVPRRNVPSVLRYADVSVVILAKVPTFRHAISNKLFDYMASGIPVILALEEGDAWEILEKAKGGVRVDPEDLASMEKWITYFLENRQEAKAMGERGKAYVLKHFLRQDLARQYLEVIQKTIES